MVLPPRCCPYCQQTFQPSPRRQDEVVCSRPECQARRRNEYRLRKRQTDPEYANAHPLKAVTGKRNLHILDFGDAQRKLRVLF